MPQLTQRFCLNLPNPLARHVKLFANFFERVVGIHVDTETHAQHLGFARRQAGQYVCVVSLSPAMSPNRPANARSGPR